MSQNYSQEDVQMGKENGKRNTSETMQEILPRLYLGECVFPTLTRLQTTN